MNTETDGCWNCKWCHNVGCGETRSDAYCQRFPPQSVSSGHHPDEDFHNEESVKHWFYPSVDNDDWCGEWTAKDKPDA